MNKDIVILNSDNEQVSAELFFSFNVSDKEYVVLDYESSIFRHDSKYNDFNIFEVTSLDDDKLYISNIPDEDWPKIKDFLNQEIFNQI